MSGQTYFYHKHKLDIVDSIALDNEEIYRLVVEIFDAWLDEQKLQQDRNGSEVVAVLKRNTEGQSLAEVYDLTFHFADQVQRTVARFIIRAHFGQNALLEAEDEKRNALRIYGDGSDWFSSRLLNANYSLPNIVVYRHAHEQVGTKLTHLLESVLAAIESNSPFEIKRIVDSLDRGLSIITSIYDKLGGPRRWITGEEYFPKISSRLSPDLLIDASRHNLLVEEGKVVIENTGGSIPGPNKAIPTHTAAELIQLLKSLKDLNSINWVRLNSFQLSHRPISGNYLKFDSKNIGVWLHYNNSNTEDRTVNQDRTCDIVFDLKDHITTTSDNQLRKIGFHADACLSTNDFKELCRQLPRIEINFRHTDLHGRNVLSGAGVLKIIDLGSAGEDLLAVSHARLEISIWRYITEIKEISVSDTERILESLAEGKEPSGDMLEPESLALSKILLAIRQGINSMPRGVVQDSDVILAYVTQILLNQRYLIEQRKEVISPAFDAVARFWIKRLRNLINETPEHSIAIIEEEPATIERVSAPDTPTIRLLWEEAVRSPVGDITSQAQEFLNTIPDEHKDLMAQPLTDLQLKVWRSHDNYPFQSSRHVVLAAPTSSGKTTVGVMFLAGPPLWNGERPRSLYIAPTRALAQSMFYQIRSLFSNVEEIFENIVISTGEDTDKDWKIARGHFSIACLVYEKANVLLAQNLKLMEELGCVVIDEIHMLMDLERGPILEMLFAKLLRHRSQSDFEKRRSSLNESLRVVVISTEEEPDLATKRFLTMYDPITSVRDIDPIVFYDNSRPVRVRHHLVLAGKGNDAYTLFPFVTFEKSEQRMLSDDRLREINKRLTVLKNSIQSSRKYIGYKQKDSTQKRLVSFLSSKLEIHPEGYRALIFVPSRGEVENYAGEMAKVRAQVISEKITQAKAEFHTGKDFEELRHLLERAEDKKMAKLIEECAEVGIFIHHADVGKAIRHEIEKICSKIPTMSQLIFATETLSYGVNLSLNDVVMLGAEFNTQSRFRVQRKLFLNGCAFHNMVGRAGRLRTGKSQVAANVYILVPANKDRDPFRDYIRRYYKDIDPAESQLFIRDDKAEQIKTEDSRLAKSLTEALKNNSPCAPYQSLKATDFSYPFVRSVLDTLRHVNMSYQSIEGKELQRAPLKSLLSFFDQTLYAQQILPNSGHKESLLFRCAVERILDDCSTQPLELVEVTSGNPVLYKITDRGEAIIDTGTELHTVEPMLRLADMLHRIWNELHTEAPFPTDLYLLCIIAQRESFRQYIGNTPECKGAGKRNWYEQMIDANREAVFHSFVEAIERIYKPEAIKLATALRYILEEWEPVRKVSAAYPQGGADSIIRFFNALIAWITGAEHSDVIRLIEAYEGPPAGISGTNMNGKMHGFQRYTEFLSWKALFLARMRATAKRLVDERIDERELHLLVSRLRLGCPTKAVPFFRPHGSNLSRREAVDLLNYQITPEWILSVSQEPQHIPIQMEKFHQLRSDLEKYAIEQFGELKNEMTIIPTEDEKRDAIYELWEQLLNTYPIAIKQFRESNGELINFNSLIIQSLNFELLESEDSTTNLTSTLTTIGPARASKVDDLYRIRPEFFSDSIEMRWYGERFIEETREYKTEHELKILTIQLRHDWHGRLDAEEWQPFANILEREFESKHVIIIPFPWVPLLQEMPETLQLILQERAKGLDSSTTFVTPAAFAVIVSSLVRDFISGEAVVMRFVEKSKGNVINTVEVSDVLEILDESPYKLPPPVREKLVRHFEVGF